MSRSTLVLIASLAAATPVCGQQASFVYRLGKDTVAVEQFTRTATRLTGELARRNPTVLRLQYDVVIGANGRPVSAVIRQRQADGSPIPNGATELRLTFMGDSVKRENVLPDSTQTRMVSAKSALFMTPVPAFGPLELLMAQRRAPTDSFAVVSTANAATWLRLDRVGGDTLRLAGGPYAMQLRFDRDGRLLSVDGSQTTNKIVATRSESRVDIAAIAAKMTPTGALSTRGTASAGFGQFQSPIMIDYGRPMVRERTVWGGVLVPFDSVWRVGANAAAHLATSRAIAFGDLAVPAGLYTLWIQPTRAGTFLIVNKAVGQWGTQYDAAQDVGRVAVQMGAAPEFTEQFTIALRPLPQNRGAIDFVWGPSMATATFTLR